MQALQCNSIPPCARARASSCSWRATRERGKQCVKRTAAAQLQRESASLGSAYTPGTVMDRASIPEITPVRFHVSDVVGFKSHLTEHGYAVVKYVHHCTVRLGCEASSCALLVARFCVTA